MAKFEFIERGNARLQANDLVVEHNDNVYVRIRDDVYSICEPEGHPLTGSIRLEWLSKASEEPYSGLDWKPLSEYKSPHAASSA